jgi:hypothetical protein
MPKNVLIIGDLHLPWTHPKYKKFCQDTKRKYKCTEVVFIGDVVDLCGLGFWEQDPDGMSPGHEMDLAQLGVNEWKKAFPKAKVCIGNHDARTFRLAKKAGQPLKTMRSFAETWETPGWDWDFEHMIDDTLFLHGFGSGLVAAHKIMVKRHKSVVMGHIHTGAGVLWNTTEGKRMFAMNVGCGIDCRSYAFHYAKDHLDRPVLGCGVVVNGAAQFIPMPISEGETYAR